MRINERNSIMSRSSSANNLMLIEILLITSIPLGCISNVKANSNANWNYSNQTKWTSEYEECGKTRQSPINLIESEAIQKPRMKLHFRDYVDKMEFKIINAHHTIKLTPLKTHRSERRWPRVQLAGISNRGKKTHDYELHHIHFHWGFTPNSGSEHALNNSRGAAEMHLVHKRKGLALEDIGKHEDSLLVVGIIIQMAPKKRTIPFDTIKLRPILEQLSHLNGSTKPFEFHFAELEKLLPGNSDSSRHFYWYQGSMSTPPCFETVMWVVMRRTLWIAHRDLQALQRLIAPVHRDDENIRYIGPNVRDLQKKNDREVFVVGGPLEDVIYQHGREIEGELTVQPN